MIPKPDGMLALEDGSVFCGYSFGARGTAGGEAVFHTGMTGYQEVLSDPSYCGQIVTMTYPLIGNYGVNADDFESDHLDLSGFIVRELPPRYSNYRANHSLNDFLGDRGVLGLWGVDTRAVTRRLRDHGSLRGVLSTDILDPQALCRLAAALPRMSGQNLAVRVAGRAPEGWPAGPSGAARFRVAALDCGIKYNILRMLSRRGCEIVSMSGLCAPEAVLEQRPDGILVGNGPGDPSAVAAAIGTLRALLDKVPLFGICLGQQLLGCALGCDIAKLKFGHHGANHPVRNLATGRIEITSQNHGFAVVAAALDRVGAYATHINLNDHSLEGFAHRSLPLFAVQYHPEAAPGPHDAGYLFDHFLQMMATGRVPDGLKVGP